MLIISMLLASVFVTASIVVYSLLLLKTQRIRQKQRLNRISEESNKSGTTQIKTSVNQQLPFISSMLTRKNEEKKKLSYIAELPRMLEVVALGIRSGLSFDLALALYARRFDTNLAKVCEEKLSIWERGLITREQGLRELEQIIDSAMFSRFVSTTLRALNYGAPLYSLLLEIAEQSRKAYRSKQQEMVAKAPVKMLLPTGVLILPAMLLLVLGPILLGLTERM